MKNIVKYYGKILFCVLVVFGPHRAYAALSCNINSPAPLECSGVTVRGSPSGCTSYVLNGVYNVNEILVGCYFDCTTCSSSTRKSAFASYSDCTGSQRYYYCDSNIMPDCVITTDGRGYCGTNSDCSGMPNGRTQCSSGCCVQPSSSSCTHGSCTRDADCTESGYESCNLSSGCCIMTTLPIENCSAGQYLFLGECVDCPTASASTMNPVFYMTQGLTGFPVTTSARGATSMTECYIPLGTYYTSTGTATLSSNCYYE